jgi:hypothetical protein
VTSIKAVTIGETILCSSLLQPRNPRLGLLGRCGAVVFVCRVSVNAREKLRLSTACTHAAPNRIRVTLRDKVIDLRLTEKIWL